MIPTFLINLDRAPDRLAFMAGQGIVFERIPGIDGTSNLPGWLRPQFAGAIADATMSAGEIGCYASHLVCADEIVERELACAIVLEDDVTLEPDFMATASLAVAAAPAGWDYIHLSTNYKRAVVHVCDLPGRSRMLVRHTRLPVNSAAYILSQAGARKWLRERPRARPNDMDIRYAWLDDLDVFGVFPAPARQLGNFQSSIRHDGKQRWSPGIASELYGLVWQARRVGAGNLVKARLADLRSRSRGRARAVPVIQ